MKLDFLGTRGNIDISTEKHQRHSSLKVSYHQHAIIIDCGADWVNAVSEWTADAILVTHAHPDHAFGLKEGAPCPVYATEKSWETMKDFKIELRQTMPERKEIKIPEGASNPISIEAFPVLHSTRAPAVGYRIQAGRVAIFYVPDVAWIKDREAAMQNIERYIGDGATLKRSMVRKPDETIIGHVPVQTQLTWCQKMGVKKAIFTHLGSQVVEEDEQKIQNQIVAMAKEKGLEEAEIADDNLSIILR